MKMKIVAPKTLQELRWKIKN